jgi:hypothetical protein
MHHPGVRKGASGWRADARHLFRHTNERAVVARADLHLEVARMMPDYIGFDPFLDMDRDVKITNRKVTVVIARWPPVSGESRA